ncbi:MAG: hypothetical protein J6Q02_01580, partial [Lachnospiraceae bacterium]|nr:hypothetical protein [Lachnospiraceae bacterium]
MNKPNPELLAKIRDGMARYNEARKTTRNNYLNESKIADEINRTLWSAILPDAVKHLEDMVGHKIQYVEKDGDVIILSVKSLTFEKWEVNLIGEGVRYTDRYSSPLSGLSYVTIKYDSLNEVLDKIKIADTATVEDLVAHVEKMRAAQLAEATKKINDKYDEVVESIRNMREPEEAEDFTTRFKPDRLHEITYFRWSDLVREFGTAE